VDVIAYGLDYLRFKVEDEQDVYFIASRFEYLDIMPVWHHGSRFMDLTGSMIEVVRMFDDVRTLAQDIAIICPCCRIDVFVDVIGVQVSDFPTSGTAIVNDGIVETQYSHHLGSRGNMPRFCRVYDAQRAGHYDCPVTRFECEFKNDAARAILQNGEWCYNPVECALREFRTMFGVDIKIDGLSSVELDAPKRRYSHNRERFYARYGKNILVDIESMGLQGLHKFILESVKK